MRTLPLRADGPGLRLEYSLTELVAKHPDLNRSLEEAFAGLLTVVCEGWPDWPIEVWTRLVGVEVEDEEPRWIVSFCIFFGGEGPDNSDVAAMVDFSIRGLQGVLELSPIIGWAGVDSTWKALWAVDDAQICRLQVPEATVDGAIFLLGSYAGQPAWFAATTEAWPLRDAGLPIALAQVDLGWAF
jgi:hypothetical protein